MREHEKLHRTVYRLVYPLTKLILRKYRYTTDIMPEIGENYLVLANHTTESDMFMVGAAFPQHMYFVCGEHLLRSKIGGLLQKYFDPISAPRGASHIKTVMEILRRIKNGNNVALFPEGCRSFNGETMPVTQATGKLIRRAGCALVTYRISGGYFIAPRWAYHFRKGKASGKIVGIYPSEQLKTMSADQITALINRDLYENAYDRQRKAPQPYRGTGLAEGLENYLLLCPSCGKYDTLTASGDTFSCSCGLHGSIDRYGFLHGDQLPYDSVYDWGEWMKDRFDLDAARHAETDVLFTETDVRLYAIASEAHTSTDLETGSMIIRRDGFCLGTHDFRFDDISELSLLYYGKNLLFTHSSGYYGMTGEHFHAWKIDRLYYAWNAHH